MKIRDEKFRAILKLCLYSSKYLNIRNSDIVRNLKNKLDISTEIKYNN